MKRKRLDPPNNVLIFLIKRTKNNGTGKSSHSVIGLWGCRVSGMDCIEQIASSLLFFLKRKIEQNKESVLQSSMELWISQMKLRRRMVECSTCIKINCKDCFKDSIWSLPPLWYRLLKQQRAVCALLHLSYLILWQSHAHTHRERISIYKNKTSRY